VLERAGQYVSTFTERFSNVVAEERYEQHWLGQGGRPMGHRELTSEFLLAKVTDGVGWVPYRDVFEVDGKAVRDRDARLMCTPSRGCPRSSVGTSASGSTCRCR